VPHERTLAFAHDLIEQTRRCLAAHGRTVCRVSRSLMNRRLQNVTASFLYIETCEALELEFVPRNGFWG